jgi:NADH-quinone oxidoreductase subunit E
VSVAVEFSAAELAEVRRLQGLYPDPRGALLPVLHMAQDKFGHLTLEMESYVAGLYFQQPKGRHVVAGCHNLSCHLAGAQEILRHLEQRLGIERGETTPDGRVTLQAVECLCACEAAPMMQVNDRYEMNLTREKVDRIVEGLR